LRAVDFFLRAGDLRVDFLRPVDFLRAVDLRAVDFFLRAGDLRAVDFLRPVDLRAVDFFLRAGDLRAVVFFLRAGDLRAVDFLRAVDLRAVDLRAVDFLRPVDLRAAGFLRAAVLRPVVFFAATADTSIPGSDEMNDLVFPFPITRYFSRVSGFLPANARHKRAFKQLLGTKRGVCASISYTCWCFLVTLRSC
jgi:hypothetical protein